MAEVELIRFAPGKVLPGHDSVLARSGCPPAARHGLGPRVADALAMLEELASPACLVRTMEVRSVSNGRLVTDAVTLEGASLESFMRGAASVSVFLATIGPAPEEEAARLQAEGMHSVSLFLDAAASSMVERLSRELHRDLAGRFRNRRPTSRFSPGFGDFDLSGQATILRLLEGGTVGVSLREDSFMLEPVKSTTGVMGWVAQND